jgi:response regulator of citrate/malate metabolism
MTYYNTTNLSGADLKDSTKKAQTQNEAVMEIFRMNTSMSPSQVWKYYGTTKAPLTSIRRSITTLTKDGYLKKTILQRHGVFGKPEYVYTLKG